MHADPKDFEIIDNLTGRNEKYVFLVDALHCTPVTVYREEERLRCASECELLVSDVPHRGYVGIMSGLAICREPRGEKDILGPHTANRGREVER